MAIDRRLSDREIVEGIVAVFGVTADAVLVIEDLPEFIERDSDLISVVCVRTDLTGDFAMLLDLTLRTPALEALTVARGDLALLQELCDAWDVGALVDDGSPGSSSWLYLHGGRPSELVQLDLDQLDENDAYVLVRKPVASAD